MARVLLTPTAIVGPHPATPSAGRMAFSFSAVDPASGNYFPFTGKEIIVLQNTLSTAAVSYTLTSKFDPFQRTEDITGTIASGGFHAYHAGDITGWKQSDGGFYLTGASAAIEVAILRYSG